MGFMNFFSDIFMLNIHPLLWQCDFKDMSHCFLRRGFWKICLIPFYSIYSSVKFEPNSPLCNPTLPQRSWFEWIWIFNYYRKSNWRVYTSAKKTMRWVMTLLNRCEFQLWFATKILTGPFLDTRPLIKCMLKTCGNKCPWKKTFSKAVLVS